MHLFPDFRDLLEAFVASGVEFVVIGGYAVIFHGRPRATKDIDLLVGIDAANLLTQLDGLTIRVLALEDLITNKRASGRPRDLEDVAELERIRDLKQRESSR
jgi:predicted nucleotidyltransferase